MNKIWLIVRKEWREVSRDKMILWTSLLLPLLFVGMTIGTVYFMQRTAASNPAAAMDDASEMNIDQLMLLPEFAGMDPFTIMIVLLVNQFLLYYLLLPLMIPMFVAVYSIIGEKQQRTLEPLLATPISVIELLTGKMLAGVIPATVLTWAS
ncbi:MAG: ABC transporter permease subunit, partial [Chloroflexi bacterium]|nr:ABC transporter permease subunit [Chloroflexota bacterium]